MKKCNHCGIRDIDYTRSSKRCTFCLDQSNKAKRKNRYKRRSEYRCIECGKQLDCSHSTVRCKKCYERHKTQVIDFNEVYKDEIKKLKEAKRNEHTNV